MTAFISIYILLGAVCVCLLSAETVSSISGPVGSTAVLPCNLTSEKTDTPYIKWQIKAKTQFKSVFERLGEETSEGVGYEGRVDVPVEELRKGICSLVLRNLRLTDTGVYTSSLGKSRTKRAVTVTEISCVYLSVYDRTEEIKPPEKGEERSGDKSDSSGNGGRNLQYWRLLVSLGLVLAGLVVAVVVVVWRWRKRRRHIYEAPMTLTPVTTDSS